VASGNDTVADEGMVSQCHGMGSWEPLFKKTHSFIGPDTSVTLSELGKIIFRFEGGAMDELVKLLLFWLLCT